MSDDRDAIGNVLAVYCHALDDGQYERLAEIFDDDTVYELTGGPYTGVAASVEGLRKLLGRLPPKRHLTANSWIEIDGDRARAVSDWVSLNRTEAGLAFAASGRWTDDLAKRDGRWVIVHRAIDRY